MRIYLALTAAAAAAASVTLGARDSSASSGLGTIDVGPADGGPLAAVAVDGSGARYVAGPVRSEPDGVLVIDTFVAKYDAAGALVWRKELRGLFDVPSGIAVTEAGEVVVVGVTESDLPQLGGPSPRGGGVDHFIARFAADGALLTCGCIGFDDVEFVGPSVAVGPDGAAYVAGWCPAGPNGVRPTTELVKGTSHRGVYVEKVARDGMRVYTLSLDGTPGFAVGGTDKTGIVVDAFGAAYVTGGISGGDGVPRAAVQTLPDRPRSSLDVFVAKVDPNGRQLDYYAVFGGSGADYADAVAVDGEGCAYVTGVGDSAGFPFAGGLVASGEATLVAKLTPLGDGLVYAGLVAGDGRGVAAATGPSGTFYALSERGRLRRVSEDGSTADVVADAGFSPMSMASRGRDLHVAGALNQRQLVAGFRDADEVLAAPKDVGVGPLPPTAATISWRAAAGDETGFEVERAGADGVFEVVASPAAGVASYFDEALAPDASYSWRVVALRGGLRSSHSKSVSLTTASTLTLRPTRGRIVDLRTGRSDRLDLAGTIEFRGFSDRTFSPRDDAVVATIAGQSFDLSGARRKGRAQHARLRSRLPHGGDADVRIDFARGRFEIHLRRVELAIPFTNDVSLSLRVGNDGGSSMSHWRRDEGTRLSYRRP